jgi:hypothetical protein
MAAACGGGKLLNFSVMKAGATQEHNNMKPKGPYTVIENISAKQAAYYLSFNKANRHVRPSHVAHLAEMMRNGEWQLTHEGVAFDQEGKLLDGQHRLHAIIAHGGSMQIMVTRGLPSKVFTSLGRGIVRTIHDTTHLPQRRVEVLSILHQVWRYGSLTMKVSPGDVLQMNEVFSQSCDLIEAECSTVRSLVSRAPIRAAVVLCYQERHGDVIEQYKRMVALDFEGMTPVVQSLVRQMMRMKGNGAGGSGSAAREDLFARALVAFSSKARDNSKIQISNARTQLIDAQNRIADLLQCSPPAA